MSRRQRRQPESRLFLKLGLMTCGFLLFAGVFGVGTVYLRKQIAVIGEETRSFETRLTQIERLDSRLTGEIAIALSPASLNRQNQMFQLNLRPPSERQIVRVTHESQERFAEFRWNEMTGVRRPTIFAFNTTERNP